MFNRRIEQTKSRLCLLGTVSFHPSPQHFRLYTPSARRLFFKVTWDGVENREYRSIVQNQTNNHCYVPSMKSICQKQSMSSMLNLAPTYAFQNSQCQKPCQPMKSRYLSHIAPTIPVLNTNLELSSSKTFAWGTSAGANVLTALRWSYTKLRCWGRGR
jgi:hypothetical protein